MLRQLRKALGLTQVEVGQILGVTDAGVCLAEKSDKAQIDKVISLLDAAQLNQLDVGQRVHVFQHRGYEIQLRKIQ